MTSETTTSKKEKKPKIITSNAEKDKVIDRVYYDTAGYGSVQTTWQEARLKDPTITLEFVKSWFSGNVQVTKQPGGQNSFVAPHAFYEFQIDLFWLVDLKNQKFKVGCLCIDIFSKYAVVVPIKSKKGQTSQLVYYSVSKKCKASRRFYTQTTRGHLTPSI